MFGIFLISLGTLFEEFSSSLGKKNVTEKVLTVHGLICLNTVITAFVFVIIAIIFPQSFFFSLLSLPTFLLRATFEILQIYFSTKALVVADRTTFSFVRTLTVPLLLLVDVALGYHLSINQIIGICILTLGTLFVFVNKRFSIKGIWFVLFSAVNAVWTISLFKYNITHYNSIVAEEMGILIILMLYAGISVFIRGETNPFSILIKDKRILRQAIGESLASVLQSLAFYFALPSILMAVKRSTAVLYSVFSGKIIFKESYIVAKFTIVFVFIAGLLLILSS